MNIEIKVKINGQEISWEKAREIYEELDKIFGASNNLKQQWPAMGSGFNYWPQLGVELDKNGLPKRAF